MIRCVPLLSPWGSLYFLTPTAVPGNKLKSKSIPALVSVGGGLVLESSLSIMSFPSSSSTSQTKFDN